jgi:hypothetical protein
MRAALTICVLLVWAAAAPTAQDPSRDRKGFDTLLDTYVRDGLVYYRALKSDRARLDAYVASLSEVRVDDESRDERLAFWIDAYNAVVLKTVIDHYPIVRRSKEYPEHSIRQIPGAFERLSHRLGHRQVTLDQIELTLLAPFHDPRVYFAIGRGAVGSGRLQSRVFTAEGLEEQLNTVAAECVTRAQCMEIDRPGNRMIVSSIFSWRSADFITGYAAAAPNTFGSRSPVERAALAFVEPRLLDIEKTFLAKNEFSMAFKPFDWSLNDLTGRGGL